MFLSWTHACLEFGPSQPEPEKTLNLASRILVTGSTGNIGRELVKQPQARGADFAVMTSAPGKAPAGVREVRGDFTQPTESATAFAGSDTLFLLFPLVPDMLDMARNAVAAAKAAGARHIVRLSGAGADSHRPASIARGHGQIDDLITGIGIAYTLPRPASLMQSAINSSAGTIKGANAIHASHGTGATAVIDVRDIAEAAAVVLTAPAAHAGASYTLTGAEAMTDAQMAAEIGRARRPRRAVCRRARAGGRGLDDEGGLSAAADRLADEPQPRDQAGLGGQSDRRCTPPYRPRTAQLCGLRAGARRRLALNTR